MQSAFIRDLTEDVLKRAGLKSGMRVLDIGCGVGDVALLASELVGPTGSGTSAEVPDGSSWKSAALKAEARRQSAPRRNADVEFWRKDPGVLHVPSGTGRVGRSDIHRLKKRADATNPGAQSRAVMTRHDHSDDDHGQGDHGHDHAGHHHGQAAASFGAAFAIGVGLNVAIVLLEVIFGLVGNSVALLADAGHNLSDVLSLLVAWGASMLSTRAPTARFTYGLRGSSILAALFNAVFLLVVIGGLSWEAILRFFRPEPVAGATVMIVAAIGIVLNGICAWLFASGRKGDLNLRAAFAHMAADALVSAGVVIAGFIILFTGWLWLDPLASLIVNLTIVAGTWSLLRDSWGMALNAAPQGIEPSAVDRFLASKTGVARVHDLHIWAMSTTETALTAHLVMPGGHPGDDFLMKTADELRLRFSIGQVTLQVETSEDTKCPLAPADQV